MIEPNFRLAQAIGCERSLMGLCILNPATFAEAAERIDAEALYVHSHRVVWQVMADLSRNGLPWDAVVLADELDKRGLKDRIGGSATIVDLMAEATSPHFVQSYANAINEAATRRQLQSLGADVLTSAEEADPAEYIAAVMKDLDQLAPATETEPFKREVIRAIADCVEQTGKPIGTPTGYPILDGLIFGLIPSDLVLIAARPSIGKTAFGLNIVANLIQRDQPVAFASLEMSRRQIINRLLALYSGYDVPAIQRGDVDGPKLVKDGNRLAMAPLELTDKSAMSVQELASFARAACKAHGPCPLVVDYLGMIRGRDGAENRNIQVAEISVGLKSIAKDLGIPVVALSQLSRRSDQRPDKRPILSDLRDSGALEQDADIVLLLHREDRGAPDAILEVAKHRNGPTGDVAFRFDGPRMKFTEVTAADPFRPVLVGPSL